ncbi:MAG: hypothetical protein C4522_12575 [Desulfobacteraceae bacterium]|nr:MAG: hypothetical protein C4522_12575 [Desulfobacteraceae bacterium]
MTKLSEFELLKIKILTRGVKLGVSVYNKIHNSDIKTPLKLRTGLSSGIDIILPDNIWVNAPINEHYVKETNIKIHFKKDKFVLDDELGSYNISIPRSPSYYDKYSTDGIPLKKIGSIRGDRLSIALNKNCIFWKNEARRCKFCAIGYTSKQEPKIKTLNQILEVLNYALHDPISPARHLYLNSGNQKIDGEDGFSKVNKIIKEIKSRFCIHIHLNAGPTNQKKDIDVLRDSGLDEISFNIDIFDPAYAKKFMPAKLKIRKLYIEMLKYSVEIFGSKKVSSCLVVGLEPIESTVRGVDFLCSIGVIPKLSPFRPIEGSLLASTYPPTEDFLLKVYLKSKEVAKKWGVPIGPLCFVCQLHSLAFPNDM